MNNNKLINKLSLLLISENKNKISKLDSFLNYQNNGHLSACDIANKMFRIDININ